MNVFSVSVLAVSLAFGQTRIEPSVRAEANAENTGAWTPRQTISVELLKQPLSRNAKNLLGKAQQAAQLGDYTKAIALLRSVHTKYPETDAWTQSMLGVEYLRTRQYAEALTSLQQAILWLPRDPVDRSNLGFALALVGQYDRAEVELRCALALDPSDPKTMQLLDVVRAARIARPQPATTSNLSCPR